MPIPPSPPHPPRRRRRRNPKPSTPSMPALPSAAAAARARASAFAMRAVARISRARWFLFLRRVYQYQNGPRSDLGSNPFNSPGWLALELGVLVAQTVVITAVVATSGKEHPVWPLRVWVAAYNVGNVLSLPLLYWRHRHAAAAGGHGDALAEDPEMQAGHVATRGGSYLMNKSRAFLELFFALWFVMGNVWVFDARLGSFQRAPRLYALCIGLLAWNAVVYSFPFLLFLLLCCFVPLVGYALGYNMNSASVGRGASDEQLAALPQWRFKESAGPAARDREEHQNQECCICLAQYKEKEEVRQLPCSHMFHLKCADRWLRIISSCPLCKQELN